MMRKLVPSSPSSLPTALAGTPAVALALAMRGWWEEVNESPAWQDAAFFSLSAAYALVSAVALVYKAGPDEMVCILATLSSLAIACSIDQNSVRAVVFGFHAHVFLFQTRVYTLVLLDLPGLLFFSTYTLLVLFWAEIYHQAKSLPTDKLRIIYMAVNGVIYVIQVCIWIYLGTNDSPLLVPVSKIFISVVSFLALLGFLIYGGRLFFMLRRFPIESKGRRKKLYEVGTVTAICFTCFLIRCIVVAMSSFDPDLSLEVLDHPILDFFYYMVSSIKSSLSLVLPRACSNTLFSGTVNGDTSLCSCPIHSP
uniref:THH1/TOM1/TOM3 domain-containing protein n=1 Tax=Leersia perrieri TaxID=77586 RepID=A0A0D9VVQ8_9ORYZ